MVTDLGEFRETCGFLWLRFIVWLGCLTLSIWKQEPKENANDLAISIWEDKNKQKKHRKKKGNKTKGQSNQPPDVHTVSSLHTPRQHPPVKSPRLERANREPTPEPPRLPKNQPSSPLFVPADETSTEEDVPLVRRKSPSSGRGIPPSTQQPQGCPVFEHVQASPIPREFLLPGESEDIPLNLSGVDGSGSIPTASTANNTSPSNGLCVPVVKRNPEIKREIGEIERVATTNNNFPIQATKEVEIAETPPASLTDLESQRARFYTQNLQSDKGSEITENTSAPLTVSETTQFPPINQSFGTQVFSRPVDIQSNYSSQISQGYSQSEYMTIKNYRVQLVTNYKDGYSIYTTFTAAHHIGSVVPESISPSQPQSSPSIPTQHSSHPGISIKSDIFSSATPKKNTQEQDGETKSFQSIMDKYSHIEGATPREKMRNAYAQLRAKSMGPFSPNPEPSTTPSSSGDIQPSLPPSAPETAPLSVRTDKGSFHHSSQPFPAEESELQTQMEKPENPAVLTIKPSALFFNAVPEVSPGSVHLGPSEFAIPLPMDSRVKDDYERVLDDKAEIIRDFIQAGNSPASEVSEVGFTFKFASNSRAA